MVFVFSLIILVAGTLGLNFIVWGTIGVIRHYQEKHYPQAGRLFGQHSMTVNDVAILIPAHQEELVIAETVKGALRLVPPQNIHVITSEFENKDSTAEIARSFGVTVLELPRPLGKAYKLQTAIQYFDFPYRFKAVLLVDADTVISPDYLDFALPYFDDPKIVAVGGHASTLWDPMKNNFWANFILSYRDRFYFFIQMIIKFGQGWKYTSVMSIVPGFASMYRTSILPHVTIDAPGLVIEDFNMTFEVHHKNLGTVIYAPRAIGYTQDPDNLKDYYKQIKRWNLGFWQTVFRHGYWASAFWLALGFYIFESSMSAIIFLTYPLIILLSVLGYGVHIPFGYLFLILGIIVVDYCMTIVAAYLQNRPILLINGLGFLFMRYIDSYAYIMSIPKAIFQKSNGSWISPTRRLNQ